MNAKFFLVFGLTLCFAVQKSSGVDRKLAIWKMILGLSGSATLNMTDNELKAQTVPKFTFNNIAGVQAATDPVTYAAYEGLAGTFGLRHFESSIAQKSMGGFSGR